MEKNTKIKVSINGKNINLIQSDSLEKNLTPPYQENSTAVIENNSLKESEWIDNETNSVNIMDKNTILETAASKENNLLEEFDWILPSESSDIVETNLDLPKKKNFHSKNKIIDINIKNNHFKKNIGSIILAIVFGTGLGFLMLNLTLSDHQANKSQNTDINVTDTNTTTPKTVDEDSQIINQLQLYVVQVGRFTKKQGADTTVNKLKNQGFAAAVINQDNAYFVVAGIGKTKKETTDLSSIVKNGSWGGKQINIKLKGTSSDKWLENIGKLAIVSSNVINGMELNSNELNNIETTVNGLEAKENEIKVLKEQLLSVSQILKNSPDENGGWKAQQILLNEMTGLIK